MDGGWWWAGLCTGKAEVSVEPLSADLKVAWWGKYPVDFFIFYFSLKMFTIYAFRSQYSWMICWSSMPSPPVLYHIEGFYHEKVTASSKKLFLYNFVEFRFQFGDVFFIIGWYRIAMEINRKPWADWSSTSFLPLFFPGTLRWIFSGAFLVWREVYFVLW